MRSVPTSYIHFPELYTDGFRFQYGRTDRYIDIQLHGVWQFDFGSTAMIFSAYTNIHLFHMHTLISHHYSPPGPPYASASIPWGERPPWHYDFQLTNFTRLGKMSPWITLELLHAFKSIQKTIKSNRTTLTIAMPSLSLMTPAQENGNGGL